MARKHDNFRSPPVAAQSPLAARRRGTILIVTMTITFTLAIIVLVLSRKMAVEAQASANQAAMLQASAIERGAEQYVMALLNWQYQAPTTNIVLQLTDDYFEQIAVGDGDTPGWFWILRPNYGDSTLPAFGLVDEASKLNINGNTTAAGTTTPPALSGPIVRQMEPQLMALPGLNQSPDIADAIIDWADTSTSDNTPSASGAESGDYLALSDPYYCKNFPFETVDELLMVRGIDATLLYGDGTAPPLGTYENAMSTASNGINGDPDLARGLYDLLTVNSDSPTLTGQTSITHGAININTAPPQVLACLVDRQTNQQVDSSVVQAIVGERNAAGALGSTDTSWFSAAGISTNQFNNMNANPPVIQFVAQASYMYSADILAVSGNGRAYKRVRIIVDTRNIGTTPSLAQGVSSASTTVMGPQIVYRRDITDRGWPMDPALLDQIKAGQLKNTTTGVSR